MSAPSVSCKVIRAAVLAAGQAGIEIPAFVARHKLGPEMLADPDARFSHDVWLAMWSEIDASGPGAFGLRAAIAIPDDHFDVFDYVMSVGQDLQEGLDRFQRYFAIVSTGSMHAVLDEGEMLRIERTYAPGAHTTIGHPAEFAFACIILRARKMTGVPLRPHEVRFAHRAPADDREHRELFECPVYFDAPKSSMLMHKKTMQLPLVGARPELSRVLQRHADTLLATLPKTESDFRARTKEAIIHGLGEGKTSVVDIAKRLAMSERTLQRRLGEIDTSHAKLLDEARSDLASRYLREQSLAIADVAFLLGFSDVPSFHRAFKRWTNATPGEHRRSLAAG